LCGRYLLRNFASVPNNIMFSQNLSVEMWSSYYGQAHMVTYNEF
jgi:hypothetical protein